MHIDFGDVVLFGLISGLFGVLGWFGRPVFQRLIARQKRVHPDVPQLSEDFILGFFKFFAICGAISTAGFAVCWIFKIS